MAFLTMKGWSLVGDSWTKEGFEIEREEGQGTRHCYRKYKDTFLALDEAYEAQMERGHG